MAKPVVPYKPWIGPHPRDIDHACAVPGCPERHASFGVERIVHDGAGNRQHGRDMKYFCRAHEAERKAYGVELNGPKPADKVERLSMPIGPSRVPPATKQGRLM